MDYIGHGRGEGEVLQVNITRVVTAEADGFYIFTVKAILRRQLVQIQLDGYPLIFRHSNHTVGCTTQACFVHAAFLLGWILVIQQFQIHIGD